MKYMKHPLAHQAHINAINACGNVDCHFATNLYKKQAAMYLLFDGLYSNVKVGHAALDRLARGEDPAVLEELRELTVIRDSCLVNFDFSVEYLPDADKVTDATCITTAHTHLSQELRALGKYILLCESYIQKAKEEKWSMNSTLQFLWSSPASDSLPSARFLLPTLAHDQLMAMCTLAATLQKKAQYLCMEMYLGNKEDLFTAATSLFRQAAGIYDYVSSKLTALVDEHVEPKSDKRDDLPIELTSSGIAILRDASMANAQAVAGYRAEVKQLSAKAMAAVHQGASELFERAASAAKTISSDLQRTVTPSLHFRKYLALSAQLHAAKVREVQGKEAAEAGELGLACACVKEARRMLIVCHDSIHRQDKREERWLKCLGPLLSQLDKTLAEYERERTLVYMQAISTRLPLPPEAKIVVSALPFTPSSFSVDDL